MAGVLIQRLWILRHRNSNSDRGREPARIRQRVLVQQRVGRRARESLDEGERPVEIWTHRAAWAEVVDLLTEIRRLDDQRLPFPMPARVAVVLSDAARHVRAAVHPDDA